MYKDTVKLIKKWDPQHDLRMFYDRPLDWYRASFMESLTKTAGKRFFTKLLLPLLFIVASICYLTVQVVSQIRCFRCRKSSVEWISLFNSTKYFNKWASKSTWRTSNSRKATNTRVELPSNCTRTWLQRLPPTLWSWLQPLKEKPAILAQHSPKLSKMDWSQVEKSRT